MFLIWVAVTRARDELYLSYPHLGRDFAQVTAIQRPSRFVRELPAGSYEVWQVRDGSAD